MSENETTLQTATAAEVAARLAVTPSAVRAAGETKSEGKVRQRVAEIQKLHLSIVGRDKSNTPEAKRIGDLVIEIRREKELTGERDFKKWVQPNLGFSYVQALKYVSLAKFAVKHPDVIKLELMQAYEQASNDGGGHKKGGSRGKGRVTPKFKPEAVEYVEQETKGKRRIELTRENWRGRLAYIIGNERNFLKFAAEGIVLILTDNKEKAK